MTFLIHCRVSYSWLSIRNGRSIALLLVDYGTTSRRSLDAVARFAPPLSAVSVALRVAYNLIARLHVSLSRLSPSLSTFHTPYKVA